MQNPSPGMLIQRAKSTKRLGRWTFKIVSNCRNYGFADHVADSLAN